MILILCVSKPFIELTLGGMTIVCIVDCLLVITLREYLSISKVNKVKKDLGVTLQVG
jgi:hypothetical protein